jgi:hypothetical protein
MKRKSETVICKKCEKPMKLFGTLMFFGYSVRHYYCPACKEIKRETA